jgi:hypothetical protein
MLWHSLDIIQNVRPEIIDTPLTIICMMGQGACSMPYFLLRQPVLLVWMDETMQPAVCWMGMTTNHWCSVDAHIWAHLGDILIVIGCSTIVQKLLTVFIGSQYTGFMYYPLNPRSSRHLSSWATTIHIISIMNDVAAVRFNAIGRRFMA